MYPRPRRLQSLPSRGRDQEIVVRRCLEVVAYLHHYVKQGHELPSISANLITVPAGGSLSHSNSSIVSRTSMTFSLI